MADRKVVAVVGATGAQGGGLVRAILADPASGFAVRALTRDPQSDKARALAALGADVRSANLDDADSVARAFERADAAYCVTNFWEHFSPERELKQATAQADAAKRAGVAHVIWSTLEDTRRFVPLSDNRMPTLMERYKVPHFDAKGEADQAFADRGVPTTYLLTSFYWENLIYFGMGLRPGADGVLQLALPMADKPLSGIAAEDIGRCAYGILKRGTALIGQRVGIAGGHPTGAEMAATLARALGREVRYVAIPFDVYRGLGFPGAEDLGNMFQFCCDFGPEFMAIRSVDGARALNPELQSFETWVARNKDRIPLG
jgi:uncharacterized protein YbjT (DUF2867 family)